MWVWLLFYKVMILIKFLEENGSAIFCFIVLISVAAAFSFGFFLKDSDLSKSFKKKPKDEVFSTNEGFNNKKLFNVNFKPLVPDYIKNHNIELELPNGGNSFS